MEQRYKHSTAGSCSALGAAIREPLRQVLQHQRILAGELWADRDVLAWKLLLDYLLPPDRVVGLHKVLIPMYNSERRVAAETTWEIVVLPMQIGMKMPCTRG